MRIGQFLQYATSHIMADFNVFIYWLAYFIPKDKKLWIFGAGEGRKYCDNSKYLFEYVHRNYQNIKCVWLTNEQRIYDEIRAKGYRVYRMFSIQGYFISMRASVAVISEGFSVDLNPYAVSSQTEIVQLWHGTPLKKIGRDVSKYQNDRMTSLRSKQKLGLFQLLGINNFRFIWRFFPLNKSISMAIAPCAEIRDIFARVFGVDQKRIFITGYPRNDVLFKSLSLAPTARKKKVLYAPTFRGAFDAVFSLLNFESSEIDLILRNYQIQLYVRWHPLNKPSTIIVNQIHQSTNIKILDIDDVYEELPSFDALLTDFSSIYFDFLLLRKPIVFAPFQYESYIKDDRELYFDYNAVTPGPKCQTWEDAIYTVNDLIINPFKYQEERDRVNLRFNFFQDGGSCERVFREIRNGLKIYKATYPDNMEMLAQRTNALS